MFNRNHLKLASGFLLAVLVLACGPLSAQAQSLILDQIGTSSAVFNSANSYASNDFTSATTSTVLVDDFNAPANGLVITDISAAVVGFGSTFVSLANVPDWQVSIYATAPTTAATSLAGTYGATVLASAVTLKTPYDTSAKSGLVSIPVDIVLPAAGKYYISVEAVNSITTNGEVAVYSTAAGAFSGPAPFPSGGENDYLFTPGATGGFGNPVTTQENGDAAYQITAMPAGVPEPATATLLSAGVLTGAAWVARRRASVTLRA